MVHDAFTLCDKSYVEVYYYKDGVECSLYIHNNYSTMVDERTKLDVCCTFSILHTCINHYIELIA